MAPEKDKYTIAWEKRDAARKEAEKTAILNQQSKEIKEISTRFDFMTDWRNYMLKIDEKVLDMKFKNFEALKNAAVVLARTLRIYEVNNWSKDKKPKFYEKGWEIFVNNWIIDDTKYMSSTLTSLFLKRSSTLSPEWRAEIQRLADFLNKKLIIFYNFNL